MMQHSKFVIEHAMMLSLRPNIGPFGNARLSRRTGHSSMLIAGWSDASNGPLIPYIQVSALSARGPDWQVIDHLFTAFPHRLSMGSVIQSVRLSSRWLHESQLFAFSSPRDVFHSVDALRWSDGWFPVGEFCELLLHGTSQRRIRQSDSFGRRRASSRLHLPHTRVPIPDHARLLRCHWLWNGSSRRTR